MHDTNGEAHPHILELVTKAQEAADDAAGAAGAAGERANAVYNLAGEAYNLAENAEIAANTAQAMAEGKANATHTHTPSEIRAGSVATSYIFGSEVRALPGAQYSDSMLLRNSRILPEDTD